MCIYIKDWFGGKSEWDCYVHALESEMWMTAIGQLADNFWFVTCDELKRMVDSAEDQSLIVMILKEIRSFKCIDLLLSLLAPWEWFRNNYVHLVHNHIYFLRKWLSSDNDHFYKMSTHVFFLLKIDKCHQQLV